MKPMKRLLCLLLVLLLVLSLAATAFAEEEEEEPDENIAYLDADEHSAKEIPIPATAIKASPMVEGNVYSVTLQWAVTAGAVTIGPDVYSWNPDELNYVLTEGEITESTPARITVTVTNYSNAVIAATLSASDNAKFAFEEDWLRMEADSAAHNISDITNLNAVGAPVTVQFRNYALLVTATADDFDNSSGSLTLGSVIVTIEAVSEGGYGYEETAAQAAARAADAAGYAVVRVAQRIAEAAAEDAGKAHNAAVSARAVVEADPDNYEDASAYAAEAAEAASAVAQIVDTAAYADIVSYLKSLAKAVSDASHAAAVDNAYYAIPAANDAENYADLIINAIPPEEEPIFEESIAY